MTPEQFVLGIIRDCNARALFCGENFTFGARAAGTPELLRQLCAPLGVEVVVLPMAQFEEKPVSSTRIRTALEGGDIPGGQCHAGDALRPSASRCITGRALAGRWACRPSISSYPQLPAAPVRHLYHPHQDRDRWYPSATGLGTRPTVNSDESKVTCETFIPGLYRRPLRHRPGGGVPRLSQPQQKSSTRWMSCASASTTQPSAHRNTLRSELYEKQRCIRTKPRSKRLWAASAAE